MFECLEILVYDLIIYFFFVYNVIVSLNFVCIWMFIVNCQVGNIYVF